SLRTDARPPHGRHRQHDEPIAPGPPPPPSYRPYQRGIDAGQPLATFERRIASSQQVDHLVDRKAYQLARCSPVIRVTSGDFEDDGRARSSTGDGGFRGGGRWGLP